MTVHMAVQVTIFLAEGDSWHHRPLHLEILKYLREEKVAGAVVLHAVAGFLGRNKVHTAHLVEAGGELPVVVIFVDNDEHVSRVLPKLREMAAHRLSTIRRADQILVVEAGRIIERGTHESLYGLGGRYFELYTKQHGLQANLFLAPGEGDSLPAESVQDAVPGESSDGREGGNGVNGGAAPPASESGIARAARLLRGGAS